MAIALSNPTLPVSYNKDPYNTGVFAAVQSYTISGKSSPSATVTLKITAIGSDTGNATPATEAASFYIYNDTVPGVLLAALTTNTDTVIPSSCTSFSVRSDGVNGANGPIEYRIRITDDGDSSTTYQDESITNGANTAAVRWQWAAENDVWTGAGTATQDPNYVHLFAVITPYGNHTVNDTVTWTITGNTGFGSYGGNAQFLNGTNTVINVGAGFDGKVMVKIPYGVLAGSVLTLKVAFYNAPLIESETYTIRVATTPSYLPKTTTSPEAGTIFRPNDNSKLFGYWLTPGSPGGTNYGGFLSYNEQGSGNINPVPDITAADTNEIYSLVQNPVYTVTFTGGPLYGHNTCSLRFFPFASQYIGNGDGAQNSGNIPGGSFATAWADIYNSNATSTMTITTTSPLPPGIVGTAYEAGTGGLQFQAQGTPTGNLSWRCDTASLPPNMHFTTGGKLYGSPSSTGGYSFYVYLDDDGNGSTATGGPFSITINPVGGTPSISSVDPLALLVAGGETFNVHGSGFQSGQAVAFISTVFMDPVPYIWLNITSYATDKITGTTRIPTDSGFRHDGTYHVGLFTTVNGTLLSQSPLDVIVSNSSSSPVLTSIDPTTVTAGQTGVTLKAYGSNFPQNQSTIIIYKDGGTTGTSGTTTWWNSGYLSCPLDPALIPMPPPGKYGAVVRVKNANGALSELRTLDVTGTSLGWSLSSTPLGNATRNAAYVGNSLIPHGGTGTGYNFTVLTGGPDSGPPAGISLEASGVFSGTVSSSAKTSTFKVRLTDSANTTVESDGVTIPHVTITVVGGDLTISTTSIPPARIGTEYNTGGAGNILASGGTTPYTFSGSGGLPSNMTFTGGASGYFSGAPNNPSQVGTTFTPSVTVTDSTVPPKTFTRSYSLSVLAAQSQPTITVIQPTQGPKAGGTLVTLTGTNFAASAKVYFGSTLASNITVSSTTTITCTTPSAAVGGPVNVKIENLDGGTWTTPSGYNYLDILTPVLSSIDKPDGPFTGGRPIVITGSNFNGVTEVRIAGELCSDLDVVGPAYTTINCTTPAYPLGIQDVKTPVNVSAKNSTGTGTLVNGYTYRPAPQVDAITPNQANTGGGTTAFISGSHFFSAGGVKPRVFIGGVEIDPANVTLVGGDD